jgi:hypothetical protein
MTDRPPDLDSGMPRWVKVLGIVAVATLVAAFALMHALGGSTGGH